MTPLSLAYFHDVILGVLQNKNSTTLRSFILSSPEMSHAFGIFMKEVKVTYAKRSLSFFISMPYLTFEIPRDSMDHYVWTAHFIRKLMIWSSPSAAEFPFFEKIYRSNNLTDLIISVEVSASLAPVNNLVSIPRRLSIDEAQVDDIKNWLPRFETVSIKGKDVCCHPETFEEGIAAVSTTLLELAVDESPFIQDGVIYRFEEEFENVHTLYVIWDHYHYPILDVQDMIDSSWSLLPKIKNVNLHLVYEWRDSLSEFRRCYDEMVSRLCRIPKRINVKLELAVSKHDRRRVNKERRDAQVARLFPAEDFIFRTDFPCISSRHKQLTDNVEFSLELDLFDPDF